MKVLLITGGNSSERTVSLNSASNAEKALIENGHTVFVYDLRLGYEPMVELSKNFDVLFPVLHGEEGEGGKLHKFLAKLNKPIVGTRNYKGLHDAWYKIPFKKYCDKNEIPTAPWKEVTSEKDVIDFGFPCVLKASNGGSSIEVVIIEDQNDLNNHEYKRLIQSTAPLFVEKYIKGIEVTLGNLNEHVLPIIEIVPTKHTWFSYDAKYDETTKEIPFAPSVGSEIQKKLTDTTIRILNELNLGSYLRVDYMVSGKDIFALDVNTIVGLTTGSLYPKQAKAAGISFNELIEILIKSAK